MISIPIVGDIIPDEKLGNRVVFFEPPKKVVDVRIWDLPARILCNKHLLKEHRDLHHIFTILVEAQRDYLSYPEIKRWKGNLDLLMDRHSGQVKEMLERGFKHNTTMTLNLENEKNHHHKMRSLHLIDSIDTQKSLLKSDNCKCKA